MKKNMTIKLIEVIKRIPFKIRHEYLESKYSKKFSSFKEAKDFCNNISNGYGNKDRLHCELELFQSNIEFFSYKWGQQHKFLFECISSYLNHFKTFPRILDLGGGFGNCFFYLKNIFKNTEINYTVVEQEGIVELSKNIDFKCKNSDSINFYESIDSAIKKNDYDLLFSSGTLQYLDNPYNTLDKINSSNFKMKGLTRVSFSYNTEYYSQMVYYKKPSNLKKNIFKDLPKNFYNNFVLCYPHTTIEEEKLLNYLKNFKIDFTNEGIEPGRFKGCYSKDISLIRNN